MRGLGVSDAAAIVGGELQHFAGHGDAVRDKIGAAHAITSGVKASGLSASERKRHRK